MPEPDAAQLALDRFALEAGTGEPLVRQIQAFLREQVEQGVLPVGMRLPSMRELADHLGVSLGIVKQAINTLTAEGWLVSSPRQGVFVAERRARLRDVALVLPMLQNEQMSRVIRGVRSTLRGAGYRLVIQAADADFDDEVHLLEYLTPALVAGAIIYPPPLESYAKPLRALRDREIPVVQVVNSVDDQTIDAVVIDGFEVGRQAVDLLLRRGHRRIGFVDTEAHTRVWAETRQGMASALRQHGLPADALARVAVSASHLDPERPWYRGELAARELLSREPDLTAVVGVNPHVTLGVVAAVQSLGRRVGPDVSVLAMGSDIPTFSIVRPAMSVVDYPMERMAERAALRLLRVMEDRRSPPQTVQLPPQLLDRDSVVRR